jgi:hypothetical protein
MVKTRVDEFADLNHKHMVIILDKVGRNDIQLTSVSHTRNSMGRLSGRTTTTSTITGDLQFVNYQDKELLSEGFVKVGDGIFYTIYSNSLSENDEIVVDSVTWVLTSRIEAETIGPDRVFQAWTCVRKNES